MTRYRIKREIDGYLLVFDSATSERMGGIRQRGTAAELVVRQALTRAGLRYRVHNRDLPGNPDIANRTRRWVVFVHGCFWHRHRGCKRATTPTRNQSFWMAKFEANIKRDRRAIRALQKLEYRVVVVWECEAEDAQALAIKLRPLFLL